MCEYVPGLIGEIVNRRRQYCGLKGGPLRRTSQFPGLGHCEEVRDL